MKTPEIQQEVIKTTTKFINLSDVDLEHIVREWALKNGFSGRCDIEIEGSDYFSTTCSIREEETTYD